jgi:uncharacterized protein (TIGR02271 family)
MNPSNQKGKVDTNADAVAAGTGGVAGAAAGAAIGSLAGPIGTIIGGLAGAVGGWWSGRAISEAATSYTTDDDAYYQQHYMNTSRSTGGSLSRSSTSYDTARPAYQLGHLAGMNPDYRGRAFEEVEPHLSSAYTSAGRNDWNDVRDYARDAYGRGRELGEQRLTLSEEELRVGKRTVQAGEVALHKTVETEHVSETVPLLREEVTIERRPIAADANRSGNIEIGEDEIRIPLMAEEAVVEKRVVGTEEVTLRKQQVTENQTVEADLRRERLDMNEDAQRLTGNLDETTRLTDRERNLRSGASGLADKIADTADDVKDRFDGNPASRPGRDATDRPGR